MSVAGEFQELVVVRKVRESASIVSLHLEAPAGASLRTFRPGQFLVFRIPDGNGGHLLRNYSLSGVPADRGRYRITVKREPSAGAGLPAGLSSAYLHDRINPGDRLLAEGPRGDFVLDQESRRPVVLLSGGVGLTPMVAMLHELSASDERRVLFLHACENGTVHALRDEVLSLAGARPNLAVHFCYRSPTAQDRADGRFHSEGIVSRWLLQSLLCLDDYDFYLCGPPPFMQAVYRILRDLGVQKGRIAYEFFGPATVLDAEPGAGTERDANAPLAESASPMVAFRKSGVTAAWDGSAPSLLSFAETLGLNPAFSCRAGICGTCKSHILAGEVSYFEDPLDELQKGEILLCCSRPIGSVVLDL